MEELRCDNCNQYICLANGDLNGCEFYCSSICRISGRTKKEETKKKIPKTIEVTRIFWNEEGTVTKRIKETIKNPNYNPN